MSPTSTFKPLSYSKTPAVFSRYRLCQTPCHPYACIRLSAVSVLAALQLSVLRTETAVNYRLPFVKGGSYILKDWNFWCSILTALTAALTLGLSVHQIRLSNKQHLFDRRVKVYMLADGIISRCKDCYMWLSEKIHLNLN